MSTVILGAGIIGVSTAYHLSQITSPTTIHLVDPSPTLFSSASGYAAGFLAKDWFPPPIAPLGAVSFEMHRRLAAEHGGREKWGYSPSTGVSLAQTRGAWAEKGDEWLSTGGRAVVLAEHQYGEGEQGPLWLNRGRGKLEVLSTGETTAQVYV
jgi:glycine/D-amino acid oxidase-like deaminating enzyme